LIALALTTKNTTYTVLPKHNKHKKTALANIKYYTFYNLPRGNAAGPILIALEPAWGTVMKNRLDDFSSPYFSLSTSCASFCHHPYIHHVKNHHNLLFLITRQTDSNPNKAPSFSISSFFSI